MPRADLDYATHVPVLTGLASTYQVRRVLELGCGRFSTPTFLNRSAFPDLELIVSIEDNRSWADEVRRLCDGDERLRLECVPSPVRDWVRSSQIDGFDLILVDDSITASDRAATIRALLSRVSQSYLIVIHDFEVAAYQMAAAGAEHRFAITAVNPNVGICWQDREIDELNLKHINRVIRQNPTIGMDDVDQWIRAFRGPRAGR